MLLKRSAHLPNSWSHSSVLLSEKLWGEWVNNRLGFAVCIQESLSRNAGLCADGSYCGGFYFRMVGHSQGGSGSVGMLPQHANMFFFPYNSETKVLQRLDDLAFWGVNGELLH